MDLQAESQKQDFVLIRIRPYLSNLSYTCSIYFPHKIVQKSVEKSRHKTPIGKYYR
nr:MAG TPA: hypothetical protein [Caudoviricetes sp.]